MSTMTQVPARDLEADLAICEAATPGPWFKRGAYYVLDEPEEGAMQIAFADSGRDARFIAAAREGWPYAIRRAMAAEAEADRLRNENAMLQEQLEQCR